jgi:hypothetical protein
MPVLEMFYIQHRSETVAIIFTIVTVPCIDIWERDVNPRWKHIYRIAFLHLLVSFEIHTLITR